MSFDDFLSRDDSFDCDLDSIMEQMDLPRFGEALSEEQLKERIENTKSKNSMKKAEWAVKIFKSWLRSRQSNGLINGLHVFKAFEDMLKSETDSQLQYFAFEVRKQDGSRYPASSLRDIFQGIGYYLRNKLGRDWRIFNDHEFQATRMALDAAMKEANALKIGSQGSGPSQPITQEQEDRLWESGILGDSNPTVLLHTIFFCCGKFFGLRGGKEHRELEFGKHIQLTVTEQGETLVYTNSYSKNYNGGLKHRNLKPKCIKVFPCNENPQRCFVRLYKLYASKRSSNFKSTGFYLRAKIIYHEHDWYEDRVLGHNTLDNLMKVIASCDALKGNFTNHSLKKTTGQRLKNMNDVQRRSHTGNRSAAQSVYEQVDDEDFASTSAVLYGERSAVKEPANQRMKVVEVDHQIIFEAPPTKKLNIQVDGDTNKIFFSFS